MKAVRQTERQQVLLLHQYANIPEGKWLLLIFYKLTSLERRVHVTHSDHEPGTKDYQIIT